MAKKKNFKIKTGENVMAKKMRNLANAALSQKEKWNIPIWDQKDGYPKKYSTKRAWKWEFLRRSNQYRRDWDHFTNPQPRPVELPTILWRRHLTAEKLASKYGMPFPLPPQTGFLDLPKTFQFISTPEITFGGNIISQPQLNKPTIGKAIVSPPAVFTATTEDVERVYTEEHLAKLAAEMDISYGPPSEGDYWSESRVWVEFDLGFALGPQLDNASIQLKKVEKERKAFMKGFLPSTGPYDYRALPVGTKRNRGSDKKHDSKELEKLLRIIDAKKIETLNGQIALGLSDLGFEYMDDSTISKNHRIACKIWKEL